MNPYTNENSLTDEKVVHRVFGTKENRVYIDREGAYIIPIKGDKVGVVETAKGFFLIGGGMNYGESEKHCIIRECIEETGYQVEINQRIGSAETYCEHLTVGFFHPIQVYYSGDCFRKYENRQKLIMLSDGYVSKVFRVNCFWKCRVGQLCRFGKGSIQGEK